jgi:hypothetical protein
MNGEAIHQNGDSRELPNLLKLPKGNTVALHNAPRNTARNCATIRDSLSTCCGMKRLKREIPVRLK